MKNQSSRVREGDSRAHGPIWNGKGSARPTGVRQRGTEATMLLVLNSHHDLVKFTLPDCASGTHWQLLIDTNVPAMDAEFNGTPGDAYGITGRSLVLYIRLG